MPNRRAGPGDRPRVLRLIYGLEAGGTETMLTRSVQENQSRPDRPCDFEVCTFTGGGRLERELTAIGVPLHDLGAARAHSMARAAVALGRLIRARGYALVHAHLYPAEVLAACTSLLAREPAFVLGKHNAWTRRSRRRDRLLERFTCSRFARIICNSGSVERAVLERAPGLHSKTCVVPNGVPLLPAVDRSKADYDVVAVGNLRDDQKGIDILLRAVAAARDRVSRVLVVGDGPERAALERLAADMQLSGVVDFHGSSQCIPELLGRARLFVLSSRYEGMPNVLLEAMAVGLPAVATDVGGVSEIMRHGETGVIVPPRDPCALADAIVGVLASPAEAARLADAGRRRVRAHFSVPAHVDRLLAVYEDVLPGGAAR